MQILYSKHFEARGSQFTFYNKKDFDVEFVQDKVSKSCRGVIRGFHGDASTYKLITCLHGKIKLVTYDIDNDKKQDYILEGDDTDQKCVLVPPRFLNAHQCLSSTCIFLYKWSQYYSGANNQWSVFYNDVDINPEWESGIESIISKRDRNAITLSQLKLSLSKEGKNLNE